MKDREVERTINLTDEEFRSLRAVFNMQDKIKRFVAGIMEEMMERQTEQEDEMWDFVAQKCGFNSRDELDASGRGMRLDFATRQIKLFKKQ